MLLKLQNFKEGETIPVRYSYDPKALDIEFCDLHYTEPVALEGTVEKGTDVLTFRGQLHSQAEMLCGRCLSTTASPLDRDFELYYEIKGKDAVDATDDLRELLVLEHPLTYVCSDTCRGLCPTCGVNLNETSCGCKQESENSLSKLKDIWKPRKEESN